MLQTVARMDVFDMFYCVLTIYSLKEKGLALIGQNQDQVDFRKYTGHQRGLHKTQLFQTGFLMGTGHSHPADGAPIYPLLERCNDGNLAGHPRESND